MCWEVSDGPVETILSEESEQSEGSDLRRRVRGGGAALKHRAPPKRLTRRTRELRRPARNAEGSDYLILITLIILIRGVTRGRAPKGGGEALRNG